MFFVCLFFTRLFHQCCKMLIIMKVQTAIIVCKNLWKRWHFAWIIQYHDKIFPPISFIKLWYLWMILLTIFYFTVLMNMIWVTRDDSWFSIVIFHHVRSWMNYCLLPYIWNVKTLLLPFSSQFYYIFCHFIFHLVLFHPRSMYTSQFSMQHTCFHKNFFIWWIVIRECENI